MAHRVKVRRVPWVKKDGTVSEKKFRWEFSCRSRGKVCCPPVLCDTEAALTTAKELHWKAVAERNGKGWYTPKRPPTVHPARRAKRASDVIETRRQNAALEKIRSMSA